MPKLFLLSAALFLTAAAAAQPHAALDVVFDFADQFPAAEAVNAREATLSDRETIRGVTRPGIFLHPQGLEDAVLRYDPGALPAPAPEERLFLIFSIGIREGVAWSPSTNGVRFSIHAGTEQVYTDTLAVSEWRRAAVELTRFGGQSTPIALHTNAIDGNTAYDWALFGDPILVHARPDTPLDDVPADIALLPEADGRFGWGIPGPDVAAAALFGHFSPEPAWGDLDLSSPFGIEGRAMRVLQTVQNRGRGTWRGGSAHLMIFAKDQPGSLKIHTQTLPDIATGVEHRIGWPEFNAAAPGQWQAEVRTPIGAGTERGITFPIFAREDTPENTAEILLTQANHARLLLHRNALGDAYLVAEAARGGDWERTADLYPLLEGVWPADPASPPAQHAFVLESVSRPDTPDEPVILSGNLGGHPAELRIASSGAGRFAMESQLHAASELALHAFRAPRVLAWNHTPGPEKDFAIFGGLEYLEGEEHSSSTRDLAYPLNLRAVPAVHKIASPIMAAERGQVLLSLLWNPKQAWAPDEYYPAARFRAPAPDSGYDQVSMALAVPSVGKYLKEHTWRAAEAFPLSKGRTVDFTQHLVVDAGPRDARPGETVLTAYDHYAAIFKRLPASAPPRGWPRERQLLLDGYFNAVWNEDPPGFSHCYDWPSGLLTGHIVPLLLLREDGLPPHITGEIDRRVDAVLQRTLKEEGAQRLWSPAGCHIVLGELPFFAGYLPEALASMRDHARAVLGQREDGLWRWHPGSEKFAGLGTDGDHTLGQAARNAFLTLRAARLSADPALVDEALEAMKQMERYRVPRGAQTWECPLYQPDILAAGDAIRAYCEAFRITGDPAHLDRARYWARTGEAFLYNWEMTDFPTMRYNVISVMGSTFFNHSWIGLPVVWCGLVYAYALQDLAALAGDDSRDWAEIARGITHSAMWQQYTEGPNRGTYPDSWDMEKNAPRPADINPENIVLNAMRLRGNSAEINLERLNFRDTAIYINAPAAISPGVTAARSNRIEVEFVNTHEIPVYALAGPLPEIQEVTGAGNRCETSAELAAADIGWQYAPALQSVILKLSPGRSTTCTLIVKDS